MVEGGKSSEWGWGGQCVGLTSPTPGGDYRE